MTANILIIGDEILIGQTIDTNSAVIAKHLNKIGIDVGIVLTVADDNQAIVNGLATIVKSSDLILTTGGLGPTKDDITKQALCAYFEDELDFKEDMYQGIKKAFAKRNIPVTEAHRLQCYIPSSAELCPNNMGTAPGMLFEKDEKKYFSMPGVPYEMEHLLTDYLIPLLQKESLESGIYHRTLLTAGTGETVLADMISDILSEIPEKIGIAYLPSLGSVKIRLTAKGEVEKDLAAMVDLFFKRIKNKLQEFVYGEEEESLEEHIGKLLLQKGLTLCTAESCTGGHIGHKITSVSGSSAYFEGGVVSYSNESKKKLLGVKEETLEQYGAVSEETVIEMQKGAIQLMNTSLSLSVSGIAGPTGGTKEKPVGTIWIACGDGNEIRTRKIVAGKTRLKNIEYATVYALNMLRQFVKEKY